MPVSADGAVFTFGGVVVGGLESWEFLQGQSAEVLHRPLNSNVTHAYPGLADFGSCVLNLYRDKTDPGQARMLASLQNRVVETCVLTHKDGTTETFQGFCQTLPVGGSVGSSKPVNVGSARIRISGPVS
jgi:hypothetical protein